MRGSRVTATVRLPKQGLTLGDEPHDSITRKSVRRRMAAPWVLPIGTLALVIVLADVAGEALGVAAWTVPLDRLVAPALFVLIAALIVLNVCHLCPSCGARIGLNIQRCPSCQFSFCCPSCGGHFKLDGKTCASCNAVYDD